MIIAISSQTGGTGKTSTSISLAAGLARNGQRTLLVDIDSQANSSKVLLPDYLRIPKDQTMRVIQKAPVGIARPVSAQVKGPLAILAMEF